MRFVNLLIHFSLTQVVVMGYVKGPLKDFIRAFLREGADKEDNKIDCQFNGIKPSGSILL
jgi:hypothetical protein